MDCTLYNDYTYLLVLPTHSHDQVHQQHFYHFTWRLYFPNYGMQNQELVLHFQGWGPTCAPVDSFQGKNEQLNSTLLSSVIALECLDRYPRPLGTGMKQPVQKLGAGTKPSRLVGIRETGWDRHAIVSGSLGIGFWWDRGGPGLSSFGTGCSG
jgi:hypothetical protein